MRQRIQTRMDDQTEIFFESRVHTIVALHILGSTPSIGVALFLQIEHRSPSIQRICCCMVIIILDYLEPLLIPMKV